MSSKHTLYAVYVIVLRELSSREHSQQNYYALCVLPNLLVCVMYFCHDFVQSFNDKHFLIYCVIILSLISQSLWELTFLWVRTMCEGKLGSKDPLLFL
jgi:hypothetical protein